MRMMVMMMMMMVMMMMMRRWSDNFKPDKWEINGAGS
jgi:hypothetical protein